MKKAELAEKVAATTSQSAASVVKAVDEFIRQTISRLALGTPLEIARFGSFEVVTEPKREAAGITISPKRLPAFSSDGELTSNSTSLDAKFIQSIAAACELTPQITGTILNKAFTDVKLALLNGDRVTLEGFGTFECATIPSRTLIDPDTGESFSSREKRTIRFSPGKDLKVAVANGASPAAIQS